MAAVWLWLLVITLGTAFGAGLYESRIVVPQWFVRSRDGGVRWHAEAARRADVGLKFWVYVTTGPLTGLTLISLAIAWRAPGAVRIWWLGAAFAALADRVMTFAYFIPTLINLMRQEPSDGPEAAAKAQRWMRLGYLRLAAVLAAWLASMMALARMGGHPQ